MSNNTEYIKNPHEWATCILCGKEEALTFSELLKNIDPQICKETFICDSCKYTITEDYIDYTNDFRPSVEEALVDILSKFSIEELKRIVKEKS